MVTWSDASDGAVSVGSGRCSCLGRTSVRVVLVTLVGGLRTPLGQPCGVGGGLGAPTHSELGEEDRDVVRHGLLAQVELVADLPVGHARSDEFEDLVLAGRPIDAAQFATRHCKLDEMIEAYDVYIRAADTGAIEVVLTC